MQNIRGFIERFGNFLLFIVLEVAAFFLIIRNNAYPRSSVLSTANTVVAWQYEMENEVISYFGLRRINEQLSCENAALRTALEYREGQIVGDTSRNQFVYREGKVVHMQLDGLRNYLTINRGEVDSVYEGMGVRNEQGAVGIVTTVGEHYSVVMPLIHEDSHLSCRFKKTDYITTLQWDGIDTRYAKLEDVFAHVNVEVGDTIVTSGLTPSFPYGIPVAVVEEYHLEEGASCYEIKVSLMADFRRLRYVELIDNEDMEELACFGYDK